MKTTMLRVFMLAGITLLSAAHMDAQIAINRDGAEPDPSAALDIQSTTGGFLMPRIAYSDRVALTPADGLLVYQTNDETTAENAPSGFYIYEDSQWRALNNKQTWQQKVPVNFASPGNFPAGAVTNFPGDGLYQINYGVFPASAGFDANTPVLITTEALAAAGPPNPLTDYCQIRHTGNCAARYNNQNIMVMPFGQMSPFFAYTPGTYQNLIWQWGSAADCQTVTDDYQFYDDDGSTTDGFLSLLGMSGDIYDQDGGDLGPSFGIPAPYILQSISSLDAGDSFELFISGNQQGTPVATNGHNVSVFIDYNSDGDFFDANEVVVSTPIKAWPTDPYALGGGVLPLNNNRFARTIPIDAVTAPTTMRVTASRFANSTSPCYTDTEGSTKDYVFNITNGVTAVRPNQLRQCNVDSPSAAGFQVRCVNEKGVLTETGFTVLIDPK